MTIKELKEQYGINNDDAKIELINGVLTLVDESKVEFKFNIGDKVKTTQHPNIIVEVTSRFLEDGKPAYRVRGVSGWIITSEDGIEPLTITDRIKTFEDACEWCRENGKTDMLYSYTRIINDFACPTFGLTEKVDDIIAYLKLRIITCALNEGWEPTEKDRSVYVPKLNDELVHCIATKVGSFGDSSAKLCFKSGDLAAYAAKQFRDIYLDYCGCKKGGQQ